MTKITKSGDCGNSPKNLVLEAFTVALARADIAKMTDLLSEGVLWQQPGRKPVLGREQVCRQMTRFGAASGVVIDHVVSHGRAGSVDGVVSFGEKQRAFCHVFEFGNAKGTHIASIKSFSLPLA